jgi:hypothetical protein
LEGGSSLLRARARGGWCLGRLRYSLASLSGPGRGKARGIASAGAAVGFVIRFVVRGPRSRRRRSPRERRRPWRPHVDINVPIIGSVIEGPWALPAGTENVEDFKKVRKSECADTADPGHLAIEVVVDAAKQETPRGKEGEDAWATPGTYDEQGEQWRDGEQVISGSSENFYEDWPGNGPRATPWMAQQWSGEAQKAEGIAPTLTAHVASRLKYSSEIEKEMQKAADVRGLVKNAHSPPGHAAGKK